jgi:hypothetical protein
LPKRFVQGWGMFRLDCGCASLHPSLVFKGGERARIGDVSDGQNGGRGFRTGWCVPEEAFGLARGRRPRTRLRVVRVARARGLSRGGGSVDVLGGRSAGRTVVERCGGRARRRGQGRSRVRRWSVRADSIMKSPGGGRAPQDMSATSQTPFPTPGVRAPRVVGAPARVVPVLECSRMF